MVLLVVIMFIPKFFNIEPMIVLSGSMEPTYHVGSLLYVNKNVEDIEVGDTITFYSDLQKQILVTHRVVEVDEKEQVYYTQGDANEVRDIYPVDKNRVLGAPIFSIPKLGYLAEKLSYTSGKVFYIALILILSALLFLGDNSEESKNKRDRK